jgi:glycerate-2-kinase
VLAAGKAAAAMAAGVAAVAADRVAAGLAVTKDGHGRALSRVAVRESSHPVPDARCEAAAREVLAMASSSAPDDVLLVLLSGGAAARLACPQPGITQRGRTRRRAALRARTSANSTPSASTGRGCGRSPGARGDRSTHRVLILSVYRHLPT